MPIRLGESTSIYHGVDYKGRIIDTDIKPGSQNYPPGMLLERLMKYSVEHGNENIAVVRGRIFIGMVHGLIWCSPEWSQDEISRR